MGYTTDFMGNFTVSPPLLDMHAKYLEKFSSTRRMKRDPRKPPVSDATSDPVRMAVGLPVGPDGGLFVGGFGPYGQDRDPSIVDFNDPPAGQPGLWCQWVPTPDRKGLEWDSGEKFYNYVEWLEYIVRMFLEPWGYVLNGTVEWEGEDRGDNGRIIVSDNVIRTQVATLSWQNDEEEEKTVHHSDDDNQDEKEEKKMSLEQTVRKTIEDFCNDLDSFTSLDVSNAVKQNGFADARHREVAQLVREAHVDGVMEDFGYSRTLIDVDLSNGGNAQAYLYHHQSVPPQQYDRRSQVAIPPVQQTVPAAVSAAVTAPTPYRTLFGQIVGPPSAFATSTATVVTATSLIPGARYSQDAKADGRLEIPRDFVKSLGHNIVQVALEHQGESIIIRRPVSGSPQTLRNIAIDRWGRIRIPKTVLRKAGLGNGRSYEISLNATGDQIRIEG